MGNELWEQHKGKLIGVAAGLLCGVIYLICGFWDMLVFAGIVLLGYYIGGKLDRRERFLLLEDIWRYVTHKWRMFR
ncbi:DUF2273 domain-containing protein [Paenibacillus athensensis]|uniref:Small integral membrane protein n=1 Tax=Paenibacillus athensensis TaxID=1967502 RepID=A0A4Y8Q2K5_9BACL|nr:DUF2273 domain-containing protein [Paenibacillus athensensis]MCD1260687.1 DUF2273 domain-containing protein [Paenibacillus athensensis]